MATTVDRAVLVAAAWAEHEAAHREYREAKTTVRAGGVSRRAVARRGRVIGARHRLVRAWMALHELGEVELTPRPDSSLRRWAERAGGGEGEQR